MDNRFLRQSPLAHLHLNARQPDPGNLSGATVRAFEYPHRVQIALRGQAADPAFLQGFEKATGFSLPTDACTSSGEPSRVHALWMGPDEWLIVGNEDQDSRLFDTLQASFSNLHTSLVNVSESRTIIHLSGPQARSVLDKGCPIDLHPRAFGPGKVVNTNLAKCHVTLHQTDYDKNSKAPAYHLYIHRSFAEYMWMWLEDASREYGLDTASD